MKLRAVFAAAVLALAVVPAHAFAKGVHLDPAFGDNGIFTRPLNPEQFSDPTDMLVAPDGRIVVVGQRYLGGGSAAQTAFGFTPKGQIDSAFGTSDPGATDFLANDEGAPHLLGVVDGKILVATLARDPGDDGPPTVRLIRMLSDGSLDPTFGSGGIVDTGVGTYGGLFAARMPDGRIVAAMTGPHDATYSFPDAMVARFLPDGSLDTSFSDDGTLLIADPRVTSTSEGPLVVLKNGDIVVAGGVAKSGGARYRARSELFKISADGRLDKSFGSHGFAPVPNMSSFISDLAVGRGGRLVGVGSGETGTTGDFRPEVTVVTKHGALDSKFGRDGVARPRGTGLGSLSSLVVQRNGSILAAGGGHGTPSLDCCDDGGDDSDALLVRLKSSGRPDRSFARRGLITTDVKHGTESFVGVAIQPSGRIVAVGSHGYFSFRGPSNEQLMLAGYRLSR